MDAGSLAGRLVVAVATALLGALVLRFRRPYGHDLERLWDLRAKAPEGEGRDFLDELVHERLKKAKNVEYEAASNVVLWTAAFALYVFVLPGLGIHLGQIVADSFITVLGPIRPRWLAIVVSSFVLVLELTLFVVILRSLWVLAKVGIPKFARWLWTARGIASGVLALLILLVSLIGYAVRTYQPR